MWEQSTIHTYTVQSRLSWNYKNTGTKLIDYIQETVLAQKGIFICSFFSNSLNRNLSFVEASYR